MEVPEQKFPVAFSQMLKMYPNVPHDVVWMHVQHCSNDIEKCSQSLKLLCKNYYDLQQSPVVDGCKNLIENYNGFQTAPLVKPIDITCNFNDTDVVEPVPTWNRFSNDIINQNAVDNAESDLDITDDNYEPILPDNSDGDSSRSMNRPGNFKEPLALHVNVDEDQDSLHSWRPNLSVGSLCPDFFMPSPTVENFQFNSNQMSNLAFERNRTEIQMNPDGQRKEFWENQQPSAGIIYGYLPQGEATFGIDYGNHLHFQKSQMNAIQFEVIKAKIELGDAKESVEKVKCELKEKMELKSVHDIEELNEEIVQLRLECQCLCTEVDYYMKDKVLLGEVDENCYSKKSSATAKPENPVAHQCKHSPNDQASDCVDEAQLWKCLKCTFDNHPAIDVCEMCHLPRPTFRQRPPYLRTPADECYCHPKKETLSIES